ncbi:MAG: sigma-70 family RNA polymerase sigma factor [Pirellulaceae bacterium]
MLYPYRQPIVDDSTIKVVRCVVRAAIRKGQFRADQFDDLVQDAFLHLMQKAQCFDPAKASWSTFCAMIVRHFLSRSRQLQRTRIERNDTNEFASESIEHRRSPIRHFVRTRTETEWIEFREDVSHAVEQLPDDLREVCECFREEVSVDYVANRLGISRSTAYRRRQMVRESVVFESLAEYR